MNHFSFLQNRGTEEKEDRLNQREGERARGKGKMKEFGRDNAPERIYRDRDTSSSREPERGRRDRSNHHHDDIPFIENVSCPEPSRGRQISDPAIYTQSPYNRRASPDSLSPAIYTLAEDVEVRGGSSAIKIPDGRNLVGIGMPRAPTIVNYPDESAAYGSFSPSSSLAGPSTRTDPRIAGFVASPLSPVPEVPASTGFTNVGHRRRRRSRSLGHELHGREYRESSRQRTPKDLPRMRDKHEDIFRKQERPRDKGRNRDGHDRDRDGNKDRDRETEQSKERKRDRQRDKERGREKMRDRDKNKERFRDQGKDLEKGKDKDKERGREKGKDKCGATRTKNLDGERDKGSGAERNKDRNRERDKPRDRDRGKGKERDDGFKDKDKKRNRDHDRGERERNHKDRERNYNRAGGQLANTPSSTLALPTANSASLDAATSVPGAYRDRSIPLGPAAPTRNAPPHSVPHIMNQLGVPMNGPFPLNPISDSRFTEILTSPIPPMHFNLPEQS